ncbi:glycosyltransferase [Treponema sp.]|uniref:glycosyltransferase n=1 Tax=Treponema sp. TaxID=166 RepID=UPI00345C3235|nr:glycosyltransferase [Treponema sp.]
MIKHILIFSAQYLPSWGGVEKYTFNLSKELLSRGHKITVVTSNVMNLSDYDYSDGIEVYRLPCINLLNGRFPVLKFWTKKFWKLNKELKKMHLIFL